jgi:hypothetical protein
MTTQEKLERLSDIRAQAAAAERRLEELKVFFLAAVQPEIDRALGEYSAAVAPLTAEASTLQEEITAEVIGQGQTVKSDRLMAVFSKARVSWDGAKLDGFALAHPEILAAKTIGKPSVSFREVKQK